jgi:hypothetical protein
MDLPVLMDRRAIPAKRDSRVFPEMADLPVRQDRWDRAALPGRPAKQDRKV